MLRQTCPKKAHFTTCRLPSAFWLQRFNLKYPQKVCFLASFRSTVLCATQGARSCSLFLQKRRGLKMCMFQKLSSILTLFIITILFGFLLQWPTIITVIMFPILVWMYTRLAKSEEKDSQKEFGELWNEYAEKTPAFIPRRKKLTANS